MAAIHLEHVDKTYPNGYVASRDLNLEIRDGELLVLVGPSGSGKSTVLRMLAGLERVSGGRIRIGERDVTHLPPQERDIAMVFQSYALYPHMTVRENLGFGLRMRKTPKAEIERRVSEVANALGLGEMLDRKPAQLSGGQRQRVALGRAIVREPQAFLFDEPLSNLDAALRVETRTELARLHRRLDATMVYVTHDQTEAMTLGDRVAVLRGGELQQVAPPMELYRRPANRFVAGFIGSPAMNFLDGEVVRDDGRCVFRGGGVSVPVGCDGIPPEELRGGVTLGVRPHDLAVGGDADAAGATPAIVGMVEPLGSEQIVHLHTPDGSRLIAAAPPDLPLRVDGTIVVHFPSTGLHLFRAGDGERIGQQGTGSRE